MQEIDYARVSALARTRCVEVLLGELSHYDGFLSPEEVLLRGQAEDAIAKLRESLRAKIKIIEDEDD